MSRIFPLFSSSKGNSFYLSGGGTSLLVDMGISLRQLSQTMNSRGFRVEELAGVLITHEHSDHIRGLPMLLKHFRLPLYASAGTLDFLITGGLVPAHTPVIELTENDCVDGIEVKAFDTPHDACHSTGFRFTMPDGRTVAFATDLGYITDIVRSHITGCDLVVLESNYDRGMLDCSTYPYSLKRRIKGDYGHLSNDVCAGQCVRLVESGTSHLILAHLSEQNNMPALAHQAAKMAMDAAHMAENRDYILRVAPPRNATEVTVF